MLFGGGTTVFAVELVSGTERIRRQVDMYFESFELDPARSQAYVLGGRDIQKFDPDLQWLWTSKPIAMDGITLTRLSGQCLHVSAERAPPMVGFPSLSTCTREGLRAERGASRPSMGARRLDGHYLSLLPGPGTQPNRNLPAALLSPSSLHTSPILLIRR